MKVMLLSVDDVIDDAEQKQYSDPCVKAWLDKVRDTMFDAEDLFDEISICELEAESQTIASKVCDFFIEIESRMKKVLEDLEFLLSQIDNLGLKSASGFSVGSGSGSKVSQKLPSTSLAVESVIYGRDDEKEIIFNWLTSDHHSQLSILSIVGMGGMGKTSLARHVYNDERIMWMFDIRAWVCVQDEFDVFMATRTILEAITKSTDDSRDLEMVFGRLKETLRGKKFLLVLDDVWNEKPEKWEAVQTVLSYGHWGSKILVTARSIIVAATIRSEVLHLQQLPEDHSWQVFAKHAFQDDNPQLKAELKEIGMKVVEKCNGSPLVLETIGRLLHTKSSMSDLLGEIDYEISKCKLEAEFQTGASKVCGFDIEIDSWVKHVLGDLEFLSSQKGDLGLKNASGVSAGSGLGSKVSQKLPSTSLVVESVIYGRDDEKEIIYNWLTSDNHRQLSILSIVGMGGMGKTTLAQHVYNDYMIMRMFDIRAWVCVSDEFDVFKVTRAILEAITKSTDDSRDLEMVFSRLKETLRGKKFLLVLDDVWNEKAEKWDAVQTALCYGHWGSKILITTRSNRVAAAIRSEVLYLQELQEDHSWHVFAKHAFQDDNPQLKAELKDIGMKIVEKCNGSPLALKTIGSLLHTKSSMLNLLGQIDYEISKCKLEAESQTDASNDIEIESRMKLVLKDLEFLSSQMDDVGLKSASGISVGSGSGSKVSQKLPSTSLEVECVFYGRDDEKEIIFNWLTSNNHSQLSILSIVGMGGMGKTTLARYVYNDERIVWMFDIRAWVCVSDEFDVFKLTRTVLEAITKSTDDSRDLEMVFGRLKEKLRGKKFLLVLDDVWNEKPEKWEGVQTALSYGHSSSKVLVTTRSNKVAAAIRSEVLYLRHLEEDDSWQVFAKHAFQDDNPQLKSELKEIGMKIVEKCNGSPLALETIGRLLHTKSSVSEWESVLISKTWELEDCEIIPALLLSYHHLPSHLKRCFAYCALFPKDYEFDKEGLILLWMAGNFLQCHKQSKSLEEIGKQYFNDLLFRSFFFQRSSPGGTCFVMHDLLNDLAQYVCGDICFRLGIDKAQSIPRMTRHFSFVTNDYRYFDGFGTSIDSKRLHTFMPIIGRMSPYGWHCKMSIHELFSKFKFLRVLSLSCCSDLKEVPDSVGNLKYLRSLDLSSTHIKKLPDSTCSLYSLEILKLNSCHNLEELPSNLHKLTNLCRLELMQTNLTKVPMHLGKLKNLQVFMSSFDVGKSSESSIQLLGELSLSGELSIGELQNIVNPLDALEVELKNKTHLVKLGLKWNLNQNLCDSMKEKEVLENLQPSKHLKKFSIRNYGGAQFPSWLSDNSLLNVVSLSLEHCKYCLCLPSLGLLPFLKELTITGLDCVVGIDADFYGSSSSSFTSLETLSFFSMKEWEEWDCKGVTGAFPRLQCLSIVECPKLKGQLPEQLCYLKNIEIRGCKQLVASAPWALDIHEIELEDCGKLQFDYHPTTLKRLTIIGHNMEVSSLKSIGRIISNASLELLHIYFCPNMNISMSRCYDFLVTLKIICGCDSLSTFPLDFFPKLCQLDLRSLNLQMISQEHAHNHLKHLSISLCPLFESFPSEGLCAPRLESFSIDGLENLKSLPECMHILLPSLTSLSIHDCPQVELYGGLPPNLKKMDLSNCCTLITSLKGDFRANSSLESLSIKNVDVESFPDEGLLPLSLIDLEIRNCLNLKKLDYKGLCQLSSLKKLILSSCPSLQHLPEEGLPKSISCLAIRDCPFL